MNRALAVQALDRVLTQVEQVQTLSGETPIVKSINLRSIQSDRGEKVVATGNIIFPLYAEANDEPVSSFPRKATYDERNSKL